MIEPTNGRQRLGASVHDIRAGDLVEQGTQLVEVEAVEQTKRPDERGDVRLYTRLRVGGRWTAEYEGPKGGGKPKRPRGSSAPFWIHR